MKKLFLLLPLLACNILNADTDTITVESTIGHTVEFSKLDSGFLYNVNVVEGDSDIDGKSLLWVEVENKSLFESAQEGVVYTSKIEIGGDQPKWLGFVN